MAIGYFLSSEEHSPRELVRQAKLAEEAGFDALWISDHYHPWIDAQGQSPFVWSVIGAVSAVCDLPIATAVTCPTVRIHPAVVAQAAATAAAQTGGRFVLGVGTGEALNEHILGDAWPAQGERLAMLAEAVDVMRQLWTGTNVNFHGEHYRVVNARLYTLDTEPPPVYVSAFGTSSAQLAGRIGDGLITMMPDTALLGEFRAAGGAGKRTQVGYKVCVADSADKARKTAHRLWASDQLPGELGQTLPQPRHFEQANTLVTEQMVDAAMVCGDEVDRHVDQLRRHLDAGFDDVYVSQVGDEPEPFFDLYRNDVLPRFR
jgi:G6PDH family F420-dependent oxidoreductase